MEDLKLLQTHHAYFQSFPLNPKRSFFTLQFTNPNFFFRKSTHGLLCQNNHIPLFEKIYVDLSLFAKYLAINYFFETRFLKLDFVKIKFHELELHQKISKFFHGTQVLWKTRFSQNQVSKK